MSRSRRRNKIISCYACERRSVSKEHVPPKSFFPEGNEVEGRYDYRKNLVTVPSCELHNLEKSDDDQYLLFVIVSSFRASNLAQRLFSKKLIRAIKRRPSLVSVYQSGFNVLVGGKPTMGYHIDRERFDRAISKIAIALYFYTYKEKWEGEFFVYSPDIFKMGDNAREVNSTILDLEKSTGKILNSQEFLGDNPEIFRYKIFRKDHWVIVRMLFYQGVVVNAFSDGNKFAPLLR